MVKNRIRVAPSWNPFGPKKLFAGPKFEIAVTGTCGKEVRFRRVGSSTVQYSANLPYGWKLEDKLMDNFMNGVAMSVIVS